MAPIRKALHALTVGDPRTHANLTLFPLLIAAGMNGDPGYMLLADALILGEISLTEVADAGMVPRLRLVNRADKPVLVVAGEELPTTRLSRTATISLLLPPQAMTELPMIPAEPGRRTDRSRSVEEPLPPGAPEEVAGFITAFVPEPHQVGAVAAVNGRVVGFELFDVPSSLGFHLPRLVRGWARHAASRVARSRRQARRLEAELLITRAAEARTVSYDAIGEGTDVRYVEEHLTGAALLLDDRVVHLVVSEK
ncbi:MAG: DUF6569 family protein [Gemmatimonadales bacterium]